MADAAGEAVVVIAHRTAVIVAWLVALLLAVALLLGPRQDAPSDRSLVPGLTPSEITSFEWSGPPASSPGFRITRDAGSPTGWRWTDPVADADPQAIEDVMAALRGAQWHRRAERAAAGAVTGTLAIQVGEARTVIELAQPLGEEQRWLVIGEHALLVDSWVARAIAPDPVAFRIHPFAKVGQAAQLEVGSFTLSGSPRRLTKLAGLPIEVLVNPVAVEQLEAALGELAIVALPNGKVPVDTNYRGTRIALDGKVVAVEAGMCPAPDRAHHAIFGPSIGPSCVSEAAWQRMLAAAAVFDIPRDPAGLASLIDRRLVPIDPIGVTLADGTALELARKPRVKVPSQPARDADPERVTELLAVLAMPGEPVALPTTQPVARVVVTGDRNSSVELSVFAGGVVVRTSEPLALRVGEGSAAILARAGTAYVDRTLWSEEPTTVRSIQLGGVTYTRGAVLGEWTRAPAGSVDATAIDQLVRLLAVPRSSADAAVPTDPISVILSIAPPSGAPSERTLLLGTTPRCAATVTAGTVALDPQVCALATKLAK